MDKQAAINWIKENRDAVKRALSSHAAALAVDPWWGTLAVELVAFKTKRKGVTVTRYRWQAIGCGVWHCGVAGGSFPSPARALRYAASHARMMPLEA